jgi:isoleucyl-tRNA synthetase
MAFCLEAEQFVDDRVSNWYVRRNRRRFWKSEKGTDKQAAYQTLYTVLTTLAKLFAPIMPFLTEGMYQNLASDRKSVHWRDFPEVSESLIDAELSADMDSLLHLVSLGSAARNKAKIKVRQPLGEMRVAGEARTRQVVERFRDLIAEELNIKRITLHDEGQGHLLRPVLEPKRELLGPKHGPKLKEVLAAVAALDPALVAAAFAKGEAVRLDCPSGPELLLPTEARIDWKATEGWIGDYDAGMEVMVDIRITGELAREGIAREIVRHIQTARKDAGLEMEDRIVLYLGTASEKLREAILAHRAYIGNETLTARWLDGPLGEGTYRADVKVDGQPLTVELRKLS